MPRQFTFNGDVVVGSKRPLWNPIINRNRNEVGKPKFNSNKHVEQQDRTYGALVRRDAEGAGDIIFSWKPTPEPRRLIDHGRDFVKLNKMSVSAGASRPDEVSEFRSEHDARIISRPGDILRLKNQVPVNIDKNKVYGTPSPCQGFSMSDLVRHRFEDEWVKEQLAREELVRKRKEKKDALRRTSPLRVRALPAPYAFYVHNPNPASGATSSPTSGEVPSPVTSPGLVENFRMRKFQGVQSKVRALGLNQPPKVYQVKAAAAEEKAAVATQ